MTDYSELERLLAEQVYLDEISSRTETIEDEHAFMDADDALDIFLTESQISLESIALALINERDQLKAEVEALRKKLTKPDPLLIQCLDDAIAEQQQIERDAERYRYLRNGASTVANSRREFIVIEDIDALEGDFVNGAVMLDAAIDSALAKEASK